MNETAETESTNPVETQDGSPPTAQTKTTAVNSNRAQRTPRARSPEVPQEYDLSSPDLYLNRELTWLNFNKRVLHEAEERRNPLLERVKFLAIVSGNLDEFFMKRIGGLKQQLVAGVKELTVDGRTPQQQILECNEVVRGIRCKREAIFQELLAQLGEHGIRIVKYRELEKAKRETLREHFLSTIFPLVTPLAMDPGHPFPFISNLVLNLLVTLRHPGDGESRMARVKVPVSKEISPRFIRVGDTYTFVTLDDLILNNLHMLFPGMEIDSCEIFRVTRNANVEMEEEEADDLLEMIQSELRERRLAEVVRLEVMADMSKTHRGMLAAELDLDEKEDVFEVKNLMAMSDLFEIASLDLPELRDPPHRPADHPRLAQDSRNIFHIIREGGPLLLQHPYESFTTTVERFLRTASEDPKVMAIKMTLYRTSAEGKIIESLINAARNGKQVAVLVELKARFDEQANIKWARALERAGIHVTYGVVGLKTHSKVILVIRRDYNGLRRYMHIGTGNYHSGTARLYTDLGILTNDESIGQDLTQQFNYLTGYSPPPSYNKVLAAPFTLKTSILEKIDREISKQSPTTPGLIQFKMNALEDADITRALYRASRAGVKVDLLVRDTCRLRSGIPGLSENVRIISIVGRFLEHARVFYFRNGGDEEYYLGSADMMLRNLESRVEIVAPVEDPDMRQNLRMILDVQLSDQRSAWEMQPDGSYRQRQPRDGSESRSCQEVLIEVAETRQAAAAVHKEKKVRKRLFKRFHESVDRT